MPSDGVEVRYSEVPTAGVLVVLVAVLLSVVFAAAIGIATVVYRNNKSVSCRLSRPFRSHFFLTCCLYLVGFSTSLSPFLFSLAPFSFSPPSPLTPFFPSSGSLTPSLPPSSSLSSDTSLSNSCLVSCSLQAHQGLQSST